MNPKEVVLCHPVRTALGTYGGSLRNCLKTPLSLWERGSWTVSNPDDARELGIASGDVVEVYNNQGSSYAMAYLEKDMKPGQTLKACCRDRHIQHGPAHRSDLRSDQWLCKAEQEQEGVGAENPSF